MEDKMENITASFLGLAIGDALGVPVEFKKREFLEIYPVSEMIGGGTWGQVPGTWSDDSSLSFILAESLLEKYNLENIASKFALWLNSSYWTARNETFDVGDTTRRALEKIINGVSARNSGFTGNTTLGNGSLMRTIPAALYFSNNSQEYLFKKVSEISAITHNQVRTKMACYFYSVLSIYILKGIEKKEAFFKTQEVFGKKLKRIAKDIDDFDAFNKIMSPYFIETQKKDINSEGYVIDSLESSIWCFLKTNNYTDCVLQAVNLGGDTDTNASLAGGLSGLYYGIENIPTAWIEVLAKKDEILLLSNQFQNAIKKKNKVSFAKIYIAKLNIPILEEMFHL